MSNRFHSIMKVILSVFRIVIQWGLSFYFSVFAIACIPKVAGFLALLVVVVMVPIAKWQRILGRVFPRTWMKAVLAAVLSVFTIIAYQPIAEERGVRETPKPTVELIGATPEQATEEITVTIAPTISPEPAAAEDIFEGVNKKVKKSLEETMEDEKLIKDFIQAAKQINLDINEIKQLEKVEDWTEGSRYLFYYKSNSFIVYCDTESKVILINRGLDQQIYKRGYEPYDINDYVVDAQTVTTLQVACQDIVKTQLNYPKTAKFSLLDWGVSREKDIYYLSSNVTAKNAFGVESEYPFTVAFRVTEDTYRPVYFAFYGTVIRSELEVDEEQERKKIEGFTEEHDFDVNSGEILIIDGELGEYGKEIEIDGKEYIVYSVPAGTYTVINKGKISTLFITSTKYYTNSSGYTENEVFETIYFKETGQEETITVLEGQQIEISYHSKYILKPVV